MCRNTWLALWDSNHPAEPDSREEQKVKDFLIKKYEKKSWYSSQPKQKPQPVPEARPLKQLIGDNAAESPLNTPFAVVSIASLQCSRRLFVNDTSLIRLKAPVCYGTYVILCTNKLCIRTHSVTFSYNSHIY